MLNLNFKDMVTFKIQDFINTNENLSDAGKALYNAVLPYLEGEDKIILDFSGNMGIPTLFLNTSLGDLMDAYGINKIKKAFKYTNIQTTQAERIQKYFADYENILK